jgi:hypothetical protein
LNLKTNWGRYEYSNYHRNDISGIYGVVEIGGLETERGYRQGRKCNCPLCREIKHAKHILGCTENGDFRLQRVTGTTYKPRFCR